MVGGVVEVLARPAGDAQVAVEARAARHLQPLRDVLLVGDDRLQECARVRRGRVRARAHRAVGERDAAGQQDLVGHRPLPGSCRGRGRHPRRRSRHAALAARSPCAPGDSEPVADPPDVVHEARVAGGRELVPQPAGVAVERAGAPARAEAPDVAQELVLGVHARRLGGEVHEQRVLHRRQGDRRVADADVASGVVDAQRADPCDPGAVAGQAAAQDGADAPVQLEVAERLRDDVVGAAVEVADARELVGAAREHDQRHVGVDARRDALGVPHGVEQSERVAVDVADDEVRLAGLDGGERGVPVLGDEHVVAVGGEVVGEEGAGGGVLLGEQDRVGGLHEEISLRGLARRCAAGGVRDGAAPTWERRGAGARSRARRIWPAA